MKIFNGTQHQISFYKVDDTNPVESGRKLLLKEGVKPYFVIEAGTNLNCLKGYAESPNMESPVPLLGAIRFLGADELPDGYDLYIVSNLYRSACVELGRDTSKLATVSGTVSRGVPGEFIPCGITELVVG